MRNQKILFVLSLLILIAIGMLFIGNIMIYENTKKIITQKQEEIPDPNSEVGNGWHIWLYLIMSWGKLD